MRAGYASSSSSPYPAVVLSPKNKITRCVGVAPMRISDRITAAEVGCTCAIVGPSGSGKTTLIAICAGLERPSEGAVEFDGVALHRASENDLARIRNQSIGFIFQNFQLLPSLTALENV